MRIKVGVERTPSSTTGGTASKRARASEGARERGSERGESERRESGEESERAEVGSMKRASERASERASGLRVSGPVFRDWVWDSEEERAGERGER
jgi:hypothetical protein